MVGKHSTGWAYSSIPCTPFLVAQFSPKETVSLGTSGTHSLGIPGFGLGKWSVTVPQLFLSQAPVSSATKVSMGRAMPARRWTASTTPSALSAAPVVSVPAAQTPHPPLSQTLMQRSTCRPHSCPALLTERYLPFPPQAGSAFQTAVFQPPCSSSEPPFLLGLPAGPALGSSPTSSLVRFGLGQQSCLGRR